MAEKGITQRKLASLLDCSLNTITRKLNGRSCFNTDEVQKLCVILDINDNDTKANIFLSEVSQK